MKNIFYITILSFFAFNSAFSQHSSCTDAVAITDGYTSGNITTSGLVPATLTATSCSGDDYYFESSDFYVYEFTTGSSSAGYYATAEISANVSYMGAGIFTTCSGTTLSGCINEDNLVSAGTLSLDTGCGLSANTTYYMVVSRWGTPDDLDFEVVSFELKEFGTGTQASDECSSATTIDLSTQYTGSTSGCYTSSSQSYCWGSLDNDSWLEFTASSSTIEFDYSITDCNNTSYGVQFALYDYCGSSEVTGSCDGNVQGTGTYSVSGLTPGSDYLFRIDGWSGNICDYTLTPKGGVAVTPTNDDCADAVTLSCGGSATGSILLATASDAPTGCGGLTAGKGVWYKFTGDGTSTTISLDNSTTNFDTELFIFEGPCGSLSNCSSDDDSGTGTTSEITFTPTNGTEYFVYVDGSGSSDGDFEITMTCNAAATCDCSTPTCPAEGLFTDIDSTTPLPGSPDANCYDPEPDLGSGTYTTCHTVTTSADGTLGLIQGMSGVCVDDIISTRSVSLYAISGGACTGSVIPADVNIANSAHSSTFNPEWYSLSPSTNYVACITFTINAGCSLDYACLDYYGPSLPSSGTCVSDDFSSDPGWTTDGGSSDWAHGTDTWFDTGANGSYLFIEDESGDQNGTAGHYVYTPVYDLSTYTSVVFNWRERFRYYGDGSEYFQIWYKSDNTAWTQLENYTDASITSWSSNSFTVPTGDLTTGFQIAFGYEDGGGYNYGAAIDDWEICTTVAPSCNANAGSWD